MQKLRLEEHQAKDNFMKKNGWVLFMDCFVRLAACRALQAVYVRRGQRGYDLQYGVWNFI